MKFGIVVFPGSNCDHDCHHVITNVLGQDAAFLWHKDRDLLRADCLILPGGFSYGDYLRSGAMAACSPIMDCVRDFAKGGGLVLGICNGFQILSEAGLLPGALMRNRTLKFICRDVFVRIENADTPFTRAFEEGDVLRIPVAHMDGNFFMDGAELAGIEGSRRILMRYCDAGGNARGDSNPNGSVGGIAGIMNEKGNVCGMMPHPERCSESLLGNGDGIKIFESVIKSIGQDSRLVDSGID